MHPTRIVGGIVLVTLVACAPPGPHAKLGDAAPTSMITTLDGEEAPLLPDDATVVALYFWATWCPPCRQTTPLVTGLAESYADREVAFVAVNVGEDLDSVAKYANANQLAPYVAMDPVGAVSVAYEVGSLPTIMLLDAGGRIQAVHEGFYAGLRNQLHNDISALLAGKALLPATSDAD